MRHTSTLAYVWLILASTCAAVGQTSTFSLGDQILRIPAPAGFFRIDGRSEAFDKFARAAVPSTNRQLAVFGSEIDLAEVMRGESPECSRTFSVRVLRRWEERSVSQGHFGELRASIRENFSEQLRDHPRLKALVEEIEKQSSEELSSHMGKDVVLDISDITPLGVFEETRDSILSVRFSHFKEPRTVRIVGRPGFFELRRAGWS